jgi:hypothetical protein
MTATAEPTLPEYDGNPFISTLPPILSQREWRDYLRRPAIFDAAERGFAHKFRKHCVLRLSRHYDPVARQIQLAERLDMLIRQGYVGRNPATTDYIQHLQASAERVEGGSLGTVPATAAICTASSFALLGCSGIGKTVAVEAILRRYPQVIAHSEPFTLKQIVWLKIECPHKASPRQLCISFFKSVDRLVGTNYFKRYAGRSTGTDEMLVHAAHVASLHALGVLVVDEIQNLKGASEAGAGLLSFLVALINTISIPVVLVGTLGAVPLLQGNFRDARRGNGVGSAIWDRFLPGAEWDYFVGSLWKLQWTKEFTQLTPEIKTALYDLTQGVADIAVKLLILAQLRLIGIGESKSKFEEKLTVSLLKQVIQEDFKLVAPMLKALRSNDLEALKKFDDLAPLQRYVDGVVASLLGAQPVADAEVATVVGQTPPADESSVQTKLERSLLAAGVATDVVNVLVADLVAKNPSGDPLELLVLATSRLKRAPPPVSKRKPTPPAVEKVAVANDLRDLVALGDPQSSAHMRLFKAGVVQVPMQLEVA